MGLSRDDPRFLARMRGQEAKYPGEGAEWRRRWGDAELSCVCVEGTRDWCEAVGHGGMVHWDIGVQSSDVLDVEVWASVLSWSHEAEGERNSGKGEGSEC